MKKFLKVFIIVILVVAVIALTCFFFFKKYKEKNSTSESLVVMLEKNVSLNTNIKAVSTILKNDNNLEDNVANKLDVIISTSEGLDAITYELSTYYIESETIIRNEEIAKKVNQVDATRTLLDRMIEEYKLKTTSSYFNKAEGLTDLYNQSCVYLVQYSELVSLINSNLPIDTTTDVQFTLYELYTIVVNQTFSSQIVDAKNINKLATMFQGGKVKIINQYSINSNEFIKFFNKIDKNEFALKLADNINNTSATPDNLYLLTAYHLSKII